MECLYVKKILRYNQPAKKRNDSERYDYPNMPANEFFAGDDLEFGLKAATLVELMDANSDHVAHSQSFQKEMISIANPKVGTPDEFYLHSLHPIDKI